ncbi:NIPSNAP family protein [Moraxella sp. ZJ142]|uniref:NIPSNAP family protein n=1 Tax=Moraxella marmotae TaxID=3344520 RepID=UPI0035D5129E
MYQLRIYTLDSEQSADLYFEKVWKNHLDSLPKFGIKPLSVFRVQGKPQVVAIVDYGDNDPVQAEKAYMQSPDILQDFEGIVPITAVVSTETPLLHEADYI